MKIGLISDTHDHVPHIKKSLELFKKHNAELILHAGDFCSPFTIPEFAGFKMRGVFGNNDGDHFRLLMKAEEAGIELEAELLVLESGGRNIVVYHGTREEITEALVMCGKYDLVVSGHTHQAHVTNSGNTLWVNPGSANGFGEDATVALYDTDTGEAEILRVG